MSPFKSFFVGVLLAGGFIYHIHGQNDGLSLSCVRDNLTPAQMANEVISSILFTGAMLILALSERTTKR